MALEDEDGRRQEVIVKRIGIPSDGAHGSAWKVAYADFVTAMMAFFLLLWLLNATTEEQKAGISNYFEPVGAVKGASGSDGLFGGISVTDPGPIQAPGQPVSQTPSARPTEALDTVASAATGEPTPVREIEEWGSEREQQDAAFEAAKARMEQALKEVPELRDLQDSVLVEVTEDGLRIVLMDQEGRPMFEAGGAALNATGRTLMDLVADATRRLPNKITVSGHTSLASAEHAQRGTDWKLALDRANAARRQLVSNGVSDQRMEAVDGKAGTALLLPDDPMSPRNRRIEVVMLRPQPQPDSAVPVPRITGRR